MPAPRLTEPHIRPETTGVQVEETPKERRLVRILSFALIVKIAVIVTIWIRFFPS